MAQHEDNVKSRASAVPEELGTTVADDPEAQAHQILTESADRTADRATVDLEEGGVERRKTDELIPDEHLSLDDDPIPFHSTTKESKTN